MCGNNLLLVYFVFHLRFKQQPVYLFPFSLSLFLPSLSNFLTWDTVYRIKPIFCTLDWAVKNRIRKLNEINRSCLSGQINLDFSARAKRKITLKKWFKNKCYSFRSLWMKLKIQKEKDVNFHLWILHKHGGKRRFWLYSTRIRIEATVENPLSSFSFLSYSFNLEQWH